MFTFQFVHLLWLGLPLAGVPVLIHLINMMRHRRVQWAAMEFLLISQKKNRTWVLLKQLLLLLMRIIAIAGIVLLLAAPILREQWGRLFGGSTTHHIVLLDDSFSMSDRWENTSAFEQAKSVIERIGKEIGHEGSQKFTLLRFSQVGRGTRGTQPDLIQETVDSEFLNKLHDKLYDENSPLDCSQTAAGPVVALEAIQQLLGQSDGEQRLVYLVSDFRARQWDDPADLKKHLRQLAGTGAKLYLIDCVEQTRPNLAITGLVPGRGTRAAGVQFFMEVTVQNFGPNMAKEVPVLLEADGQAQPAISVAEIPPGKAVKERFPVRFTTPGEHRITARLEADTVAADNFRYDVVDVPPTVPILLINGDPQGADAKYLAAVFNVGGAISTGLTPRIESPRFLAINPLESFRAIYLLNVDRLDKAAIAALERYLQDGGGVGFFVGERTDRNFTNAELYRDGQGPFPVPLDHPAELLVDYLQKAPDLEVTRHPIFQIFAGARNSFLPMVIVSRYFAVPKTWKAESDPSVQVIARLRNGAPLAVEKKFGQGRVVAFLTTAAPVWNNWARDNPSYVVSMLELEAFLASQPAGAAMAQFVGAPLELKLDAAPYEPQVRFATPHEDTSPTGTIDAETAPDGRLVATLASTDTSGFYEARLARKDGTEEVRRWAYNVEAEEGDLRALSRADLATRLADLDPKSYQIYQARAFQYSSEEQAGYNLTGALLSLLILLLIGEQIVAWWASYHPPSLRQAQVAGGAA